MKRYGILNSRIRKLWVNIWLCMCLSAVPHSNLYIVISPVCATVDYLTIEWLNEFLLDLAKHAVSPAVNYLLAYVYMQ